MSGGGFDSGAFLAQYWQKKPLLIRNFWPQWRNPLSPDELAGLAGEAQVESRLVTCSPEGWNGGDGPFAAEHFGDLGGGQWTLLVQAVDHYVPEVAAILDDFRFIPNWRIDDVMVSYAADGGGVGPHFDQYDVFLIQGLGQRRWQIGGQCNGASALLPHDTLKLLADFEPSEEWVLEPGDILYVPPGWSHNGVAVGDDCMTYSVGFRAPSRSELVSNWADDLLADMDDDDRFTDPDLALQANPGEISPAALARLHAMVSESLCDRDAFARWFGKYSSTPKYPEVDWQPDTPVSAEDVSACLGRGERLLRNPASRFAFVTLAAGGTTLFVDGTSYDLAGDCAQFARQLGAAGHIVPAEQCTASDALVQLITDLINQGSLAFEGAD